MPTSKNIANFFIFSLSEAVEGLVGRREKWKEILIWGYVCVFFFKEESRVCFKDVLRFSQLLSPQEFYFKGKQF